MKDNVLPTKPTINKMKLTMWPYSIILSKIVVSISMDDVSSCIDASAVLLTEMFSTLWLPSDTTRSCVAFSTPINDASVVKAIIQISAYNHCGGSNISMKNSSYLHATFSVSTPSKR